MTNFFYKVKQVDEQYLTNYAKQFLKEHYRIYLSVPVVRNNRLRTSLGRFIFSYDSTPLRIELSGNVLTYGADEIILGVLRHECIHYAFYVQGRTETDGDAAFEAELRKHDAPSTRTTKVGKFYRFTCMKCGKESETAIKRLKINPEKYRTTCCQAAIRIVGERTYNGLE